MIIDSYVVIITIVELIFLQVSPHPLPLALCPLFYSHCPEIIIKGVKLLRPRTQGEVAKLDIVNSHTSCIEGEMLAVTKF